MATAPKRRYGSGSVYRRPGTLNWLIKYQVRGPRHVESSRSTDRAAAERMLDERIAARDKLEARRRAKQAAQRMEFGELSWVDLLAYSVRTLVAQLRQREVAIAGVYFVRAGNFVKIGYASDFEQRKRELECGNPTELELLGLVPGPRSLEPKLHALFAKQRERGEWFRHEGLWRSLLRTWRRYTNRINFFTPC